MRVSPRVGSHPMSILNLEKTYPGCCKTDLIGGRWAVGTETPPAVIAGASAITTAVGGTFDLACGVDGVPQHDRNAHPS